MKTLRIVASVLLLSFVAFAQDAAKPADAQALVEQGRKLAQDGKHADAIKLFGQAIAADKNNLDAHIQLGVSLDLEGNYAEARKHFDHAVEIAEQRKHNALRQMSMSYAFEGKPAEAEEYHQKVFNARLAKNDYQGAAGIANELARLYIEGGNLNNAERWYRTGYETVLRDTKMEAADKHLWEFRWHHALARLAARRGNHAEALKHVADAKMHLDQSGDKDQQVYYPYLTGYVAFYNKDYKTAIADLERANQDDPFIVVLLAQAHENAGNKAKAEELYRKVLTFNSHNPTNAFARPIAKQKLGMK